MNHVIELDTNILIESTKRLWAKFIDTEFEYLKGAAIIDHITHEGDELIEIHKQVPWVTGKIGFIALEPGGTCWIHKDRHDGSYYQRSLNIILESDGDNHTTRYYDYLPGNWDESKNLYDGPLSDIKLKFEFTLKKPTVFFNQDFHDVYNYGTKRRVTALWLIDPKITDQDIFDWCTENNIPHRVLL
jgi:hypothetical protein